MQNDDKSHYEGALLEEIRDQNKAILERLEPLAKVEKGVDKLENDMTEVKVDIKTIKMVVKDHSVELKDHERRVTQLESA